MPLLILPAILEAVKAGFEFLGNLFAFLATAQGQEMVKDWRADTAEFKRVLGLGWDWLVQLFSGQIIKFDKDKLSRVPSAPKT